MRILQVIDNLYAGGAERVLVNLCNWLHEEGVQVEVALIIGNGKELLDQIHPTVPVHFIERKKKFGIRPSRRLADLLIDFDLAHIHMRQNFRYVKSISVFYQIRTPLLFHDHFGKIRVDTSIPFGFRRLIRPEYYIGVSKELTNWATKRLGIEESNVFLLENVVERVDIVADRKEVDLVLVSNIKPQKNQLFAIEVASQGSWSLDIYGGRQDLVYSKIVEDEILFRSNRLRINLITDCNSVQRKLGKYKLGLHTSNSETGPLSIIEYLAQGLPFLAFRTGEAAEKISKDFPDFFIDSYDVNEWVQRIEKLINHPPDSKKMAQVFELYFNKTYYLEKCLEIYRSILRY